MTAHFLTHHCTNDLDAMGRVCSDNFGHVLTSPEKTFDWKIGGTQAKGFAKKVNGKMVVIFVAKEGPYQGKILSSMVPGAKNMTKWGLW